MYIYIYILPSNSLINVSLMITGKPGFNDLHRFPLPASRLSKFN